ncbi:MAG: S8 family peptidase [Phycisphaeraceae bacterium]|nr:S8 family peptidase [Phycisphaeraceae bacterium]
MPQRPNFLLGRGENLVEPIVVPGRPVEREAPYSIPAARERLEPMLVAAVRRLEALPDLACPHDQTVASITLHPEYIAKSYFPSRLINAVGLRTVGSRGVEVTPERRSMGRVPEPKPSTEVFVAGPRGAFRDWADKLPRWTIKTVGADDLAAVEKFAAIEPAGKIKAVFSKHDEVLFEVVLHASDRRHDDYILEGFRAFLRPLGVKADMDLRFYAGGLCFLRMKAPKARIGEIAEFSFLRAAREMPRIRVMRPIIRGLAPKGSKVSLPTQPPLDPSLRVAVFDGGLPDRSPLSPWAVAHDTDGVGRPLKELHLHGHAVTSALLFGSIDPDAAAERPFAAVDHYRVLDEKSHHDPYELYDVLQRIKSVLETKQYEFINLSMGPAMPVDDDDVHAWTSVLDEYLSEGTTIASIAVGNGGEDDAELRHNRIQVPADCVNGLSIGACDSAGVKWKRAVYSSIGPGRSPGIVKPDLLAFGGSDREPYLVLDADAVPRVVGVTGTSFASPDALRSALGIRAHFGQNLSPLAIKALLIHGSENPGFSRTDIGWGRIARTIEAMVICPPGMVSVVYQGKMEARKFVRAPIPMPGAQLAGRVSIRATFCFSTPVDPGHSGNYTRSGLEVFFRPDKENRDPPDALHAKTDTFFRPGALYPTEDKLRRDAHKWETCLHAEVTKLGRSLNGPVFDVHYNARAESHSVSSAPKIRYALVVTVEAPRVADLYDQVLRRYRNQLEPINPIVQIPLQT